MTDENPFRVGLETERTPAPCVFVIFGASGDLTRRKLMPALYNLAVSRLLPPGMSIVGFALTEMSARTQFRASMRDARRRVLAAQADRRGGVGRLREPPALRVGQVRGRRRTSRACARSSSELDRDERHARQPHLLPRRSRRARSAPSTTTSPPRAWSPSERRGKYARIIIEKPFGRDLASARGAQRRSAPRLRRAADLPHRPLPRQGDGPEPRRAPLRQRDLRAALEPQPHRPRADHRGRGHRRRGARQVLRRGRAPRATSCRTTSCSC